MKTNDLRLKLYPAVIAILGLSLVALLLTRVEIQVSNDAGIDESISAVDEVPEAPIDREPLPPPVATEPSSTPSPRQSPVPNPALAPSPTNPESAPRIAAEGGLRISNQSRYPIRIALLSQPSSVSSSSTPDNASASYTQPVHWDFAPEEGSSKGLILSLPDAELQLQPGDVLVAFAQDGSRRYWGPYVVGKTPSPVWSAEQKEWLLILQP